jgi:transcriptional regulator with GAF, ATPase, and Fis domain
VRELQNVIERAVITSTDGHLDVRRFLRVGATGGPAPVQAAEPPDGIHTVAELELLERRSIVGALDATAWRVAGAGGAADRLGAKPSTLRSRMKALGIERPR